MKHLFLIAVLFGLSAVGYSDGYIECVGKSQTLKKDVKIFVDLENGKATVEVLGENGFKNNIKVTPTWDGHMTGLVTGSAFALKYEYQYGCLRNVTVVTNVRQAEPRFFDTINVPLCSGGTTSEEYCR